MAMMNKELCYEGMAQGDTWWCRMLSAMDRFQIGLNGTYFMRD